VNCPFKRQQVKKVHKEDNYSHLRVLNITTWLVIRGLFDECILRVKVQDTHLRLCQKIALYWLYRSLFRILESIFWIWLL